MQAQLTQEVKRADSLSAELERQQDDSSRGPKSTTKSHRGTGDILAGRATSQGAVDPLIPASRPTATAAGTELELLRRKLKVCMLPSHPFIALLVECMLVSWHKVLLTTSDSCIGQTASISDRNAWSCHSHNQKHKGQQSLCIHAGLGRQ